MIELDGNYVTNFISLILILFSFNSRKEAAGVIPIPFHSTCHKDNSPRQETAVMHIFPPCQFSKNVLKIICPSMDFSNGSQTPPSHLTAIVNDEHLMVVIIQND